MADAKTPRPFDVTTVEYLVRLMSEHDLSEIDLHEADQRIRIRRGATVLHAAAPLALPAAAEAAKAEKQYQFIKSEMVGTFYAKPDPKSDDYVKVGSRVKPDSVVCKIEAMKIFNDITAGVAGTIAEVCVQNAQPVEFGTVLFKVDAG